jgi:hypothetical protein
MGDPYFIGLWMQDDTVIIGERMQGRRNFGFGYIKLLGKIIRRLGETVPNNARKYRVMKIYQCICDERRNLSAYEDVAGNAGYFFDSAHDRKRVAQLLLGQSPAE